MNRRSPLLLAISPRPLKIAAFVENCKEIDKCKRLQKTLDKRIGYLIHTPKDEKLYLRVGAAFQEKQDYDRELKIVELGLRIFRMVHDYTTNSDPCSGNSKSLDWPSRSLSARHRWRRIQHRLSGRRPEKSHVGDLSQAMQIARTGIQEGFRDYQLLALLGEALIQAGVSPGQPEFSEAKEALEKSIVTRPRRSHRAFANRAAACSQESFLLHAPGNGLPEAGPTRAGPSHAGRS